jgi:GxxExxY protein
MKSIEELARKAIDIGLAIHRDLGPGLLESVYESLLAQSLTRQGFNVIRQKAISFTYDGLKLDEAFKADLIVEDELLIELKAVEKLAPVHTRQTLTYLRLLNLPLGLLINFGAATFKEGVERVINKRADLSAIEIWQREHRVR